MALTKVKKQEIIADLTDKFKDSKSVFFSSYLGLSVNDLSEMRRDIKESGSKMVVAKKTLIKIAAKNAENIELPDESMDGAIACVFSNEDEIAAAKVVAKWAKSKKDFVTLTGGIFEGKALSKDDAIALSKIPAREELLAKLLGSLKSPISGFVRSLKSPISGFTNVCREISQKGN